MIQKGREIIIQKTKESEGKETELKKKEVNKIKTSSKNGNEKRMVNAKRDGQKQKVMEEKKRMFFMREILFF